MMKGTKLGAAPQGIGASHKGGAGGFDGADLGETGKELIALPDRALCKKAGKKIRNILKETLQLFQAYDWPGNIRELQNGIRESGRAVR
jgi:hypothetical protein